MATKSRGSVVMALRLSSYSSANKKEYSHVYFTPSTFFFRALYISYLTHVCNISSPPQGCMCRRWGNSIRRMWFRGRKFSHRVEPADKFCLHPGILCLHTRLLGGRKGWILWITQVSCVLLLEMQKVSQPYQL